MSNPSRNPQQPSQQQQPWTSSPPSTSSQSSSSGNYSYAQAPQYPPAFAQPQPQQHQQAQRQTTPLPAAYPPAFQPHQQQTAFHHYQPPQPLNTVAGNHQITAPFQIPRLPYQWPAPAAQSPPIDPRLLSNGRGGEGASGKENGNAQPGQWRGQQ